MMKVFLLMVIMVIIKMMINHSGDDVNMGFETLQCWAWIEK